ncbi:MAG TPA: bifunctional oligoribonuclease/PAP phosphatase NrnA [Bacteroidetes bacterium]|nr:bifunctional oligoribonuclease/PAP phosphatase NrnA [Bacteroidota bacterium]
MPDTLDSIRDRLLAAQRIVLTTHIRPDGDALGSEIALGRWLRGMGKAVYCLNADPEPKPLRWLMDEQPKKLVRVYDPGALSHAELIAEADLRVVVDTNAEHRMGDVGRAFRAAADAGKPVLLLDHHPDAETWFTEAHTDTGSAATGEIIYDLIAGHDPSGIDRAIATALYVAIMTDTGSFRFGATTPRTHAIISDLLARGDFRPEPIHIALYDGKTHSALRLLGLALGTIRTHYGGRLASMTISQETLRASGADFEETEGLVQYPLSLEGVVSAVIFLETLNGIKISFRSKGDCPINKWAGRFGGGGHPNASGAYVTGKTLEHVRKEVLDAAPPHVAAPPEDLADADDNGELSDEQRQLLMAFQGKLS